MVTKPIKVDEEVKDMLDKMKEYPRETYADILRRLLKLPIIVKNENKKEVTN